MQKITPFLWFNGTAEEAMNFSVSIFKNSMVRTFSPAISFFVSCETQAEVDELWEKLSAGGRKDRCGWLQDKFGVSWQIIPTALGRLLGDRDPQKSQRAMKAMLQMDKIEIERLEKA